MSQQDTVRLNRNLQTGASISIQGNSKEELAASVATNCSDETWLELSRPASQPPFQEEERVLIKYWDEGAIVYCWEANVIKIAGPTYQHVAIAIRGHGITVQQRRAYRVESAIPFSFSVIYASEPALIGQKILRAKTQNISVAGMRFETSLGLKAGDKLEMNFRLPATQKVNAVGWVVRTEAVGQNGNSLNSVALKFLQVNEENQMQLMDFLAQAYDQATAKPAGKSTSAKPQSSVSQPVRTQNLSSATPGQKVNQQNRQKSTTFQSS